MFPQYDKCSLSKWYIERFPVQKWDKMVVCVGESGFHSKNITHTSTISTVAAGSVIHVNKLVTTFFQGKDTWQLCEKLNKSMFYFDGKCDPSSPLE